MTLKLWISVFALILVAGLALAPAVAQKAKDGQASPPAGDQMTQMLTMMEQMQEQMQEQMKGMREQMAGMQGMGGMQGRINHMMGSMGRMHGMMQQHRAEMEKVCPAMPAPGPKQGG